jgi:aspartate kinase
MDMEKIAVHEIAVQEHLSKVTIAGLLDRPGIAAEIFTLLGDAGLNVELVSTSHEAAGTASLSFVVRQNELSRALGLLHRTTGYTEGKVSTDEDIGIVTVSGGEVAHTPGAAGRMFRLLSEAGINIGMISASLTSVSCAIPRADCRRSKQILESGFEVTRAR